jgi:DNA-binding NarL/FixJ family response regulator
MNCRQETIKMPSTNREGQQERLSVALIDSRSLIRDALAHRLRTIRGGCDVLLFSSAADLVNDIAAYENVDLILVSARDEVLDAVQQLSAVSNSKRIIIISDSDEGHCIAAGIRQGARGYIPTNLDLAVAMAAVEVVLAGGTFAPASSLLLEPAPDPNELMQQPAPGPCGLEYSHSSPEQCIGETPGDSEPAGGSEVTTRELEVLACLAKAKSNKMIARELDIREGTVKVHVRSLLQKLNATNRTELALRTSRALDTAQAVRCGRLTIPADPAADQGSTDTSSRSQETESTPVASYPTERRSSPIGRPMRDQRGWNQGKPSSELGKPQSVVSRLEDPSHGKVTVQTLLEVAAFDVALQIRFVPFSTFLQQTRDVSTRSMQVVSFSDDFSAVSTEQIRIPSRATSFAKSILINDAIAASHNTDGLAVPMVSTASTRGVDVRAH